MTINDLEMNAKDPHAHLVLDCPKCTSNRNFGKKSETYASSAAHVKYGHSHHYVQRNLSSEKSKALKFCVHLIASGVETIKTPCTR